MTRDGRLWTRVIFDFFFCTFVYRLENIIRIALYYSLYKRNDRISACTYNIECLSIICIIFLSKIELM